MRYEDRLPPEDINTPNRNPLREFFKLSAMALLAIIAFGYLLNIAGGTLGGFIPFKFELWLAERIDKASVSAGTPSPFEQKINNAEFQSYLQTIADKVTDAMELDESIPITIHHSEDGVVNAFATIGGHVYFFNGLLNLLPHENALTMLMAHEISHVSLRHTAKGLGSGIATVVGTSLMGLPPENRFFGLASTFTSTSFSRRMETDADTSALHAVNRIYGHVDGADELFHLFMAQRTGKRNAEKFEQFISTHPLDQNRIDNIADLAKENDWVIEGEVTPLPDNYQSWTN